MRNHAMRRSLHSRTANRPERSDATQRPWRFVVLSDGSRNVFGGSDGREFVCTTGFGGQSEADALHIVAFANVIHEGGETPDLDIDLDATLALLDKTLAEERAEAKHHRVVMAEWPLGSETHSEASKAALRADRDAHLAKTLLSALPSLVPRRRVAVAIDRITRKWARASFDETIIAPLPEIEEERRLFGLPDFTAAEISEFNPSAAKGASDAG